MHRLATALVAMLAIASCTEEPREDPKVINALSPRCDDNQRYVMDVCVELGSDDSCVDVGDSCIALCDELASCTTVSGALRVVRPWPVAPNGYCVECAVP